jgi:hypothetical protein
MNGYRKAESIELLTKFCRVIKMRVNDAPVKSYRELVSKWGCFGPNQRQPREIPSKI